MAYTSKQLKANTRETLKSELTTSRKSHLNKPDGSFFYELEAAIVIDVIRDENILEVFPELQEIYETQEA